MAVEDFFKNGGGKSFAIGVGVAVLTPVLLPVLAAIGKPLAKAAIKSGIVFYEKGRETVAELGETFEDLVAEAQAEIHAGEVESATEQVSEASEEIIASTTKAKTPPKK